MATTTTTEQAGASDADQRRETGRSEAMRAIGTGFGSLGGASILFLSVLLGAGRPDAAQQIAIDSLATALPLLVYTTVAAYSLSLIHSRPSATARAFGATILFGLIGALGVVIAIAAMLWRLVPIATISFVGCALVALVVYTLFARQVAPPRPEKRAANAPA